MQHPRTWTSTVVHPDLEHAIKALLPNLITAARKCAQRRVQPAIVWDIDDTIVFSDEDRRHPLEPRLAATRRTMQRLYYDMLQIASVYFVTARTNSYAMHELTMDELKARNIAGFEMVSHCPEEERTLAKVPAFKHRARTAIEECFRREIICTVGDRWSDHLCVPGVEAFDEVDAGRQDIPVSCLASHVVPDRRYKLHQHTQWMLKVPCRDVVDAETVVDDE